MGCVHSRPQEIISPGGSRVSDLKLIPIDSSTFVITNDKNFQEVYILGKSLSFLNNCETRTVVHRDTREERAVKIFTKEVFSSHSYDKLKHEVTIVKKLDHPNIIRFFETFEDSKKLYVVMEMCKGGELFEQIVKNSRLTEVQVAKIMKELLSAVAYAHENNVVHRDIKPENILLEERGKVMNIKLVNFASATHIEEGKKLKGMVGTAYYIAPEVIDGEYDEKCDMWSVGVVLYMLLSSDPPFDGDSDGEILRNVSRSRINFKKSIWTTVSNQAKDLLHKLLCPAESRISAREALTHAWVTENTSTVTYNIANVTYAFENLKKYDNSNIFKDAVKTFIATQCVTSHDSKKFRETFKTIDLDGDGKLSREELISQYSLIFKEENAEEEIDKIMKHVDTDNNGFINYTEFLKAAIPDKTLFSSQNLKRAFELFDRDRSGSIDASELKKILEGGVNSADQVWKEIINTFDQNSDGEIDLKEFEDILTRQV